VPVVAVGVSLGLIACSGETEPVTEISTSGTNVAAKLNAKVTWQSGEQGYWRWELSESPSFASGVVQTTRRDFGPMSGSGGPIVIDERVRSASCAGVTGNCTVLPALKPSTRYYVRFCGELFAPNATGYMCFDSNSDEDPPHEFDSFFTAPAPVSKTATHETGDASQYDEVRTNANLTFGVSQEAPAYEGSWEGKAAWNGSTAGALLGGGALAVNWPPGYQLTYGAAFYFPVGTFTGAAPKQKGRVDIVWWDNYSDLGTSADFGAIAFGPTHLAFLLRARLNNDQPQEIIGRGFRLGEGCWNWLVVRQRFSDKPPSDPDHAINEVYLNGSKIIDSPAPNSYGRVLRHVRFGLPYVAPTTQDVPLSVLVDNAYVSDSELRLPRANTCQPPDTTITSGPSGTAGNGAGAKFEFTSSKPNSTFECRIDAGAWATCQSPKYFTGLEDGPHTVSVRAIDAAHNEDPSPATRTWTADGEANAGSHRPSLSGDGRFLAFESDATNLVDGDTNGARDVFLQDSTSSGVFRRISVSSSGQQSNGASGNPAVSDDGRFVAFESSASNLVAGDTNGVSDVFLYDVVTQETRRVSVTDSGAQIGCCGKAGYRPAISRAGRYVAFVSDANAVVSGRSGGQHVYVWDRATGRTVTQATVGLSGTGGGGSTPSISLDGRFVAFQSGASDLVTGDTNSRSDVFVRDRTANTTRRVSVSSNGAQGNGASGNPSISDDGRYVAFDSQASNLVTADFLGASDTDTNGASDVFRHDRTSGATIRISKNLASAPEPNGGSYSPAMSASGQYIAFESDATNNTGYTTDGNGARDIFRWQGQRYEPACCPGTLRGPIDPISFLHTAQAGNAPSASPAISNSGQYVAFATDATNLAENGDTHTIDILRHDYPLDNRSRCVAFAADRRELAHLRCHIEAHENASLAARAEEEACFREGGDIDECAIRAAEKYKQIYDLIYIPCMQREGFPPPGTTQAARASHSPVGAHSTPAPLTLTSPLVPRR
jgi:Tol biopolymer transport system component